MENSKLMTPLFYDGNFNRAGHKMRAVFEREISDGAMIYRLWRSAGKPDREYPRDENDKYLLHVEINDYLAPLQMSDSALVDHCGYMPAVEKLYGGNEGRKQRLEKLRQNGDENAISTALGVENEEIRLCGSDPACQAGYIRKIMDDHVSTYLTSKENGGNTFPDFIGALVLNDLAKCMELSTIHKALYREEQRARAARAEAEEREFCEERNSEARKMVDEAVSILRNGGVLENKTIKFYRSRYSCSSYSIFNYLMRQYNVKVPLRTQGWINDKLCNATIKDGSCVNLQFLRAKNSRGSQKFFECMDALILVVTAQALEQVS